MYFFQLNMYYNVHKICLFRALLFSTNKFNNPLNLSCPILLRFPYAKRPFYQQKMCLRSAWKRGRPRKEYIYFLTGTPGKRVPLFTAHPALICPWLIISIVGGCQITGMWRIWQRESSERAREWESDRGEQVNGSLRYLLQLCTCFCLFFAALALTSLARLCLCLWLRLWQRLHLHFDLLLPCLFGLVEFCMWRV